MFSFLSSAMSCSIWSLATLSAFLLKAGGGMLYGSWIVDVLGCWGFRYTEKAPPWCEGERKFLLGTSGQPPALVIAGFTCAVSFDMAEIWKQINNYYCPKSKFFRIRFKIWLKCFKCTQSIEIQRGTPNMCFSPRRLQNNTFRIAFKCFTWIYFNNPCYVIQIQIHWGCTGGGAIVPLDTFGCWPDSFGLWIAFSWSCCALLALALPPLLLLINNLSSGVLRRTGTGATSPLVSHVEEKLTGSFSKVVHSENPRSSAWIILVRH